MSNTRVTYVLDDTAADLVAVLSNANGVQDLTGVTAVVMRVKRKGSDTSTALNCTVDTPATLGQVRYSFSGNPSFVPVPGEYVVEWQVTFGNGTKQTFPNTTPLILVIRAQVR